MDIKYIRNTELSGRSVLEQYQSRFREVANYRKVLDQCTMKHMKTSVREGAVTHAQFPVQKQGISFSAAQSQ